MPYTPTEYLLIEHDGPVVTVTFNHPGTLNSFNDEIHRGMVDIWEHLEVDRSVRAVVDVELLAQAKALADRLAAQPVQAVQETKRALNIHLQHAIQMVAPFALAAEAESFGTDDVKRTIERFTS